MCISKSKLLAKYLHQKLRKGQIRRKKKKEEEEKEGEKKEGGGGGVGGKGGRGAGLCAYLNQNDSLNIYVRILGGRGKLVTECCGVSGRAGEVSESSSRLAPFVLKITLISAAGRKVDWKKCQRCL